MLKTYFFLILGLTFSADLCKKIRTPIHQVAQVNMIIVTALEIEGREIERTLGLVRGNTVRTKNMGRDIFAGIKNIVGGEILSYTKLMSDSREQAIHRMVEDARKLGADAVIGVRLSTSLVMQGTSEMLAYGTAVRLKS